MLLEEYKELNLKKGTIHSVHWRRPLKSVLKPFRDRVEKETIGRFRIGVTYANMAINKDKITGSLPYGMFEYSNEIIWSEASKTHQLRLTQTMGANKPTVKYYLDGEEITKEKLIEMNALNSEERKVKTFDPKEKPVFNVSLDYILEIK